MGRRSEWMRERKSHPTPARAFYASTTEAVSRRSVFTLVRMTCAVQGGLGGDLVGFAGVDEAILGDVEVEVLGHLVAVDCPDLVGRAAGRRRPLRRWGRAALRWRRVALQRLRDRSMVRANVSRGLAQRGSAEVVPLRSGRAGMVRTRRTAEPRRTPAVRRCGIADRWRAEPPRWCSCRWWAPWSLPRW
jgi:hypothetical protein